MAEPEKKAFFCAACKRQFDLSSRTIMPSYNKTMEKLVTSYICPDCVSQVAQLARAYASKAFEGERWYQNGGLKENDVIEDFVGFFLNYDLDFAIKIRYAPSLETAVKDINEYLAQHR